MVPQPFGDIDPVSIPFHGTKKNPTPTSSCIMLNSINNCTLNRIASKSHKMSHFLDKLLVCVVVVFFFFVFWAPICK